MKTNKLIKELKAKRVDIDRLIQLAEENRSSAYKTLALRSLQMGKGWLGQALGAIGEPHPYPAASEVKDIPAAVDVCTAQVIAESEELPFLNDMRELIKNIKLSLDELVVYSEGHAAAYQIGKACDHLVEARMWYGWALGEAFYQKLNNS